VRFIDLQEDIKEDRAALNAARRLAKGERMSDESAAALKREPLVFSASLLQPA
jgi:hypothetical protein